MPRPLMQHGVGQLEAMFGKGKADAKLLKQLEHELQHRHVPRAVALLVRRAGCDERRGCSPTSANCAGAACGASDSTYFATARAVGVPCYTACCLHAGGGSYGCSSGQTAGAPLCG